ncbi:hypothetical protein, partial [Chryseobacterium culicis]|uniref:hypothetical protein n=1 Tax=Chryseobacterium culicis TaxID=680127 RepID=UPI001E31E111
PMVLRKRESRPPPVFILFLKNLYHNDKGFFVFIPYTIQYNTYSTVQYSTVQYSTVQYSTVQYSTVQDAG